MTKTEIELAAIEAELTRQDHEWRAAEADLRALGDVQLHVPEELVPSSAIAPIPIPMRLGLARA